jgi:hypothetical protein
MGMDWSWMVIAVLIAFFLSYREKERRILRTCWPIMGFMGIGWIILHLTGRI